MISSTISTLRLRGGAAISELIAGDERLAESEMANATDMGLFGPSSMVWRVHADSAMFIGAIRALLLQTLHPKAMAAVADHSSYRTDPLGRLNRTGRFVAATSFGNTKTANQQVRKVNAIHKRISGVTPDGQAYEASDPHLLLWVHVTEVDSFLKAFEVYGEGKLTDAEKDQYVAEVGLVATKLGAANVPQSVAELGETIEGFKGECQYNYQTEEVVRFLLAPSDVGVRLPVYVLLASGAAAMLPLWARQMLKIPVPPGLRTMAIRPASALVSKTIGWLLAANQESSLPTISAI